MGVWFSTTVSEAVIEGRWAAEFHRPCYKFFAKDPQRWRKIGRCSKFCQYGLSIKMNEVGQGMPIYRLNEIENCFLSEAPSKFAKVSPDAARDYELKKQDILFCRTNGNINYVGRTGLFLGDNQAVFASYLVRVRTDKDQLLPEYLTIYLNTEFGRNQILRRAMPSNQVNVSAAELKRIDTFLAPKESQKVIAELVQSAYRYHIQGISSCAQAQHLLESELELDELSFQKPVGYTAQFSELEHSRRSDAEFFDPVLRQFWKNLSKRFEMRWLPLMAEILKFSNPEYGTTGIPIVTQKHLRTISPEGYGEELRTTNLWTRANALAVLKQNDLLFYSVGAYLGKTNIWLNGNEAVPASFITLIRCREEVDAGFLQILLNSRYGILQSKCFQSGTSQQYIYPKDIRKFLIPVISERKKARIHELLLESYKKEQKSKRLLDQAKTGVEQLIEEAVRS